MKILVISDIHGSPAYISRAEDLIRDADLIAITGDISHSGKIDSALAILGEIEKFNKNILAVHGNWDRVEILDLLEEKEYSLHSRGKIINNMGFFGVGGSNPTPMKTASEYSEEEILDYLQTGYRAVSDCDTKILITHTPPHHTRDRTFLGLRGGSPAIRNFIEENNINLCLCGHIHEAKGTDYIDSCAVVNPGPFKKGKYSVVEISETAPPVIIHDKIKGSLFR